MSANNELSRYTPEWLSGVLKESKNEATAEPLLAPGGHYARRVGAGDGDTYVVGHAEPARGPCLMDHEIAAVVNELRRIALDYGGSQQLRERLAGYIAPILRGERRP